VGIGILLFEALGSDRFQGGEQGKTGAGKVEKPGEREAKERRKRDALTETLDK
jgi:hypothetical protein